MGKGKDVEGWRLNLELLYSRQNERLEIKALEYSLLPFPIHSFTYSFKCQSIEYLAKMSWNIFISEHKLRYLPFSSHTK